jgi:stage IV sporulation protein FB
MDFFSDDESNTAFGLHAGNDGFPPKPMMAEKSENSLVRSLFSLLLYFLLFYMLFEQNLAYIAGILVVIIIHEFGHLLAMKLFNYSQVKIFIIPLIGALTSGKKQTVSQWQLSIIILAGPLPGLLIAWALFYLNADLENENLKMLANSFLFINLFNLLPIYPLDGGRLLETLFFKQNHLIRLIFGILSIMALVTLFVFSKSLIMLIVPIMMGIELYNEHKNEKIRQYLKQENIDYQIAYKELPDKYYWLIRDCILFSFSKKFNGVQPGHYQYSVMEPVLMQQVNHVLQIHLIKDLNLLKRLLFLILYLSSLILPLILYSLHL